MCAEVDVARVEDAVVVGVADALREHHLGGEPCSGAAHDRHFMSASSVGGGTRGARRLRARRGVAASKAAEDAAATT
eukprot:358640-Chlamydomonas_euryale.AAC.1